MPIADDLKKLARDAVADIGQTYQNMLWQDAGFAAPLPRSGHFAPPGEFGRTFDIGTADPVERTPETINIHVTHSFDDIERG